jgi:hypothetical protein
MDFQGGLKKLSQDNAIRLATSLFVNGFCAPFFVWDRQGDAMCLDGHQRTAVLCGLREAGVPIPKLFPVVRIDAMDEADARRKLLAITSQYGEFVRDQLDGWLLGIDDEIKNLIRLVDGEIEIIPISEEEQQNKPTEQNLEPYKKIHVLLSMSPETFFEVQELLKNIKQYDLEYEQSKN